MPKLQRTRAEQEADARAEAARAALEATPERIISLQVPLAVSIRDRLRARAAAQGDGLQVFIARELARLARQD